MGTEKSSYIWQWLTETCPSVVCGIRGLWYNIGAQEATGTGMNQFLLHRNQFAKSDAVMKDTTHLSLMLSGRRCLSVALCLFAPIFLNVSFFVNGQFLLVERALAETIKM